MKRSGLLFAVLFLYTGCASRKTEKLATVDYSRTEDGYILVRCFGTTDRHFRGYFL